MQTSIPLRSEKMLSGVAFLLFSIPVIYIPTPAHATTFCFFLQYGPPIKIDNYIKQAPSIIPMMLVFHMPVALVFYSVFLRNHHLQYRYRKHHQLCQKDLLHVLLFWFRASPSLACRAFQKRDVFFIDFNMDLNHQLISH